MGNKQTHDPLFGYPEQPTRTTMHDGREVSAGEATELGFKGPHWARPFDVTLAEEVGLWNGLTDHDREQAITQALVDLDEAIISGAKAVDLGGAVHQAGQELLGDALIDCALAELKAAQKPWQQLTEDQQRAVLDRITSQVKDAVAQTMRLLSTRGARHVVCELESLTVKKGVKATLEIPKGEMAEDLVDAVGQAVILVVGAMPSLDEIQPPKPDPDQRSLLDGKDALAVHSDPEG